MENFAFGMICVALFGIWYTLIKVLDVQKHYLHNIQEATRDIRDALTCESADVLEEREETPEVHESHEQDVEIPDEHESEKLSSFDLRIARMKDELAQRNVPIYTEPRTGTTAEIYHPDVQNLPHNIINDYNALPDVEIAE